MPINSTNTRVFVGDKPISSIREIPTTIDVLFLAKNRLEFTRESVSALLANTNWSLVRNFIICDDGSTDGTREYVNGQEYYKKGISIQHGAVFVVMHTTFGSPAAAINSYAALDNPADILCKLDNDVIVPPGWLDQCAAVMEAHPELDLLGIEPPASRVPHFSGGVVSPKPELIGQHDGYAPCDTIGGVGLMRTSAFTSRPPIQPSGIYAGFQEWQRRYRLKCGWCVPPLKLFLLDRLDFSPWIDLSREYEAKGFQRAWGRYPMSAKDALWGWWQATPAGCPECGKPEPWHIPTCRRLEVRVT